MDRTTILEQLTRIDSHIQRSKGHVAQQREIVDGLRRNGADTTAAEILLRGFEEAQSLHMARRDRLLADLGKSRG